MLWAVLAGLAEVDATGRFGLLILAAVLLAALVVERALDGTGPRAALGALGFGPLVSATVPICALAVDRAYGAAVRWGVHLPLVDFGAGPPSVRDLQEYVRAARDLGYDTVGANDHLVWQRPWIDGPTALSTVAGSASGMTLATTVALPAVRHPVVLAKALTTLAVLHDGPVIAGVGPGSSAADHAAVGLPFAQRWSRFDAATGVLRDLLRSGTDGDTRIAPLPERPVEIWVGSWGSPARLRATAGAADGWMASGYNTTPARYAECRARLDAELWQAGRDPATFPDLIATVWLHVAHDASAVLAMLASLLRRDPAALAERLPVGTPEHCAEVLAGYARAGARRVLLWPVGDGPEQLRRFTAEVAPRIPEAG